jgi:probable HAF family extracellular repeat protein
LADEVLKSAPQRPLGWHTLALANYRLGHWQAADTALQRCIEHRPERKSVAYDWALLSLIRFQQRRTAEALQWYEKAKQWHAANRDSEGHFGVLMDEVAALSEGPLAQEAASAAGTAPSSASPAAAELFLGFAPGGTVSALSGDGRVVYGASPEGSFRWTKERGVEPLADLPANTTISAVSADGSVIVGTAGGDSGYATPEQALQAYANRVDEKQAFRWSKTDGLQLLGAGFAQGVSRDGGVVAFTATSRGQRAFRWEPAEGAAPLGHLAAPSAKPASWASGISGDGQVLVGSADTDSGNRGVLWREATGMVEMGPLPPGYQRGAARTASRDGSICAGQLFLHDKTIEAACWTSKTGWVGLGDLDGGRFWSSARGISADGSIIVGIATDAGGRTAFIWDAARGMRNLATVLGEDYGLRERLAGWNLGMDVIISDDGRAIAGTATTRDEKTSQPWVVFVPVRTSGT